MVAGKLRPADSLEKVSVVPLQMMLTSPLLGVVVRGARMSTKSTQRQDLGIVRLARTSLPSGMPWLHEHA